MAVQIGWSKAGELCAKPERADVREAAAPDVYGWSIHVKVFQLPFARVLQLLKR